MVNPNAPQFTGDGYPTRENGSMVKVALAILLPLIGAAVGLITLTTLALDLIGYATTIEQLHQTSERTKLLQYFLRLPTWGLVILILFAAVLVAWPGISAALKHYPRPRFSGSIEAINRQNWSSADGVSVKTSCVMWIRLTNSGIPSCLKDCKVIARAKTGAALTASIPYSQSLLPTRPGPPSLSLYDVTLKALGQGQGAEVTLGFDIEASFIDIDFDTLRLAFSDLFGHGYQIRPSNDMELG